MVMDKRNKRCRNLSRNWRLPFNQKSKPKDICASCSKHNSSDDPAEEICPSLDTLDIDKCQLRLSQSHSKRSPQALFKNIKQRFKSKSSLKLKSTVPTAANLPVIEENSSSSGNFNQDYYEVSEKLLEENVECFPAAENLKCEEDEKNSDAANSLGTSGNYDLPCNRPSSSGVSVSPALRDWNLGHELATLNKKGWYWGPISRKEAEVKLYGLPNGSFLVRDSSDDRYLLSISFRAREKTLHTRIEHYNSTFSFYSQPESEGYRSIIDLIEKSISNSDSPKFCHMHCHMAVSRPYRVHLSKPVSRFSEVRSLQYLCRFIIRENTRRDHLQNLPLPLSVISWLTENQY